ncbi:MAG TPA: hypothetical protein VFS43_24610 [Polyangiaceae bacterium]|nr:hypothetical protein [Polyangiaceae bacterium]
MPRHRPPFCVALAALAALAPGGAGGCGGEGGDAAPKGLARGRREIAFEEGAVGLELGFGRVRPVRVRVSPPEAGLAVRFALIGDVADAALDAGRAVTDGTGEAFVAPPAEGGGGEGPRRVSLHASSREASFVLEARLDGGERAELGVTVSSLSKSAGSVAARPSYSGKRVIDGWVAQARPGETCASVGARPVPVRGGAGWLDELTVEGEGGDELAIDNLTPGEPFALLVWGGPYARGCQDVAAGVKTAKLLEVDVAAQNVELDTGSLRVSVTLRLDPASQAALAPTLDRWGASFLSAFQAGEPEAGPGVRGAGALVEAMREHIGRTDAAAADHFAANVTAAEIGALAALPMPNAEVSGWLQGARALLEGAASAPLSGGVRALGGGAFWLDAAALLGVPFGDVAGAGVAGFGLVADSATDRIAASGEVGFNHGALLAVAIARSLGVDPDAFDATLRGAVSCPDVAEALRGAGAFLPACDEACAVAYCEGALEIMWDAARTAGAGEVAFSFAILGAANFDDRPALTSWSEGTWSGEIADGGQAVALLGTARATQATE